MRRVISRLLPDTGVSRGRLCSEAWTAPGHICRRVEAAPALHSAGLLCHSTCPLAAEKRGWLLREGSQPARREPRGCGGGGSRSYPVSPYVWGVWNARKVSLGLDLEIEIKMCKLECWCQGGKLAPCTREAPLCGLCLPSFPWIVHMSM